MFILCISKSSPSQFRSAYASHRVPRGYSSSQWACSAAPSCSSWVPQSHATAARTAWTSNVHMCTAQNSIRHSVQCTSICKCATPEPNRAFNCSYTFALENLNAVILLLHRTLVLRVLALQLVKFAAHLLHLWNASGSYNCMYRTNFKVDLKWIIYKVHSARVLILLKYCNNKNKVYPLKWVVGLLLLCFDADIGIVHCLLEFLNFFNLLLELSIEKRNSSMERELIL